MIFVTVGTTPFPFYRMVEVVKTLIKTRKKDEVIIFQHGNTQCNISEKNVILYRYLPFNKMQCYIKTARIIVTHGGPATIYQVLVDGKKPHVLPREKAYGEHVNDHQKHFCQYLLANNDVYRITGAIHTPLVGNKLDTIKVRSNSLNAIIKHLESEITLRRAA